MDLAKAKTIVGQIKMIEAKQEAVRQNMAKLKRSVFNQMKLELEKHSIPAHDELRFYLFIEFLSMIAGKTDFIPVGILGYPELLGIIGAEGEQDKVGYTVHWLDHWVGQGKLRSQGHPYRGCRNWQYTLVPQAEVGGADPETKGGGSMEQTPELQTPDVDTEVKA